MTGHQASARTLSPAPWTHVRTFKYRWGRSEVRTSPERRGAGWRSTVRSTPFPFLKSKDCLPTPPAEFPPLPRQVIWSTIYDVIYVTIFADSVSYPHMRNSTLILVTKLFRQTRCVSGNGLDHSDQNELRIWARNLRNRILRSSIPIDISNKIMLTQKREHTFSSRWRFYFLAHS